MEILVKVVQFIICFTLLVGIHEFGHFITARIFGMRVDKFYIFFDPWFSIYKWRKGDTEYGIGWLPLGGYCKIAGMVDESMDKEQLAQPPQPDEFRSKPAWQRFIVMVAGVALNILLAIVIYIGISYTWGESYMPTDSAKWGYVFNETGHDLGFEDGDKILAIDGERIDDMNQIVTRLLLTDGDRRVVVERGGVEQELVLPLEQLIDMRKSKSFQGLYTLPMPFIVDSVMEGRVQPLQRGDELIAFEGEPMRAWGDYRTAFAQSVGSEVEVSALRGGDTVVLSLAVDGDGRVGVYTLNPYQMETRYYTIFEAVPAGLRRAGATVSSYWNQLKLIAKPQTEMYRELGGFMAIGNMFSDQWNWEDFWMKTAFLSVILAVMNILPIPGLDGGHALITLFEIVTGRKPSDKFLEVTQTIGLFLLLALMLYANGNDIVRLFTK